MFICVHYIIHYCTSRRLSLLLLGWHVLSIVTYHCLGKLFSSSRRTRFMSLLSILAQCAGVILHILLDRYAGDAELKIVPGDHNTPRSKKTVDYVVCRDSALLGWQVKT